MLLNTFQTALWKDAGREMLEELEGMGVLGLTLYKHCVHELTWNLWNSCEPDGYKEGAV